MGNAVTVYFPAGSASGVRARSPIHRVSNLFSTCSLRTALKGGQIDSWNACLTPAARESARFSSLANLRGKKEKKISRCLSLKILLGYDAIIFHPGRIDKDRC